MTTKTLSQLCYLNREVARLRQSLAELRAGGGSEEAVEVLQNRLHRREQERDRLWRYIDGAEDARMRMILDLRFAKRLSWVKVAERIGGGNTADGVRKACFRYLREH